MSNSPKIKICGIRLPETAIYCDSLAVDYLGFVHFSPSPRHIDFEQMQQIKALKLQAKKVAVLVNPSDEMIAAVIENLSPDYLQMHGGESLARLKEVEEKFGLPIIRAISIENKNSLRDIGGYIPLFDAKAPKDSNIPGGNAVSFDWNILSDFNHQEWFLSGGLDAKNIAAALRITKAPMVDISSGVESMKGVKDHSKIAEFVRNCRE